jgi:hypothetical protein
MEGLNAATVGLHLAARGGKQAKSKAVIAVARKLAVLLHRIWTTQEPVSTPKCYFHANLQRVSRVEATTH